MNNIHGHCLCGEVEIVIKEYEERLRLAMLNGDIEESDTLFSDDLVFTNHLGQIISKADDMSAIKQGLVKVSKIETAIQNIRIVGDVAVVVSDCELEVVIDNEKLSDHFIYTRIWQKFDDDWKLVGGQATRYVMADASAPAS